MIKTSGSRRWGWNTGRARGAALWAIAGIVGLGLSAGAARASRPEIEQLLRDMQMTVIAGDVDAYVRLVDSSDPVFFQESRNWAADLPKHKLETFEIRIKEPAPAGEQKDAAPNTQAPEGKPADAAPAEPAVRIGDGVAEAPIELSWSLEGWKAPRTLSWTARFRKDNDRWVYCGEKWNRLESGGVLVLYADGLDEAARAVADVLPEVRKHTHPGFGFDDHSPLAQRTQQVKLYASMPHLQESIYLSYTDGLSGWNEPNEAVKLLVGRRTSRESLKPLLAHEYGHVATFALGDTARMPWWILEGAAELSAEDYSRSRDGNDQVVRRWKAAGQLPPFEEMAAFDDRAKKWYGQVYGQGHHMLGYISDRFGREQRIAWLSAQAQGKDLDTATRDVLGMSFAELDRQWRDSIGPVEDPKAQEKKSEDKKADDSKPKDQR